MVIMGYILGFYIGIMEKRMETAIWGLYRGYIGAIRIQDWGWCFGVAL